MSIAQTSWPREAKHAAVTTPDPADADDADRLPAGGSARGLRWAHFACASSVDLAIASMSFSSSVPSSVFESQYELFSESCQAIRCSRSPS